MKEKTESEIRTRLAAVRNGEEAAFSVLLSDFTPLLSSQIARFSAGLSHEDREDLWQVARYAFYRACLGYDLGQSEVGFGLYAKICVSNALSTQLRAIRRRTELLTAEPEELPGEVGEDPARQCMEEEALLLLHTRIAAVLSPFENRVWRLYTAGYRSGEIARLLGKEPHSIENAVYRIRQKLRRALFTER